MGKAIELAMTIGYFAAYTAESVLLSFEVDQLIKLIIGVLAAGIAFAISLAFRDLPLAKFMEPSRSNELVVTFQTMALIGNTGFCVGLVSGHTLDKCLELFVLMALPPLVFWLLLVLARSLFPHHGKDEANS